MHIVTDSGARFSNPHLLSSYPITVVPYRVTLDGTATEDSDAYAQELSTFLLDFPTTATAVEVPTVADYVQVFGMLSLMHDHIISIHTSRELTESWHNATMAASQLTGSTTITVIDSRSICAGQGLLVRHAAEAAIRGDDPEDVAQWVRTAVERLYCAFYVEELSQLRQNEYLSASRMILATMLDTRVFVGLENGEFAITEKVHNRAHAVDRLVEFLAEFEAVEDAAIVHQPMLMNEHARELQNRLTDGFPGQHFAYTTMGAPLVHFLGPSVLGVVVLEREY